MKNVEIIKKTRYIAMIMAIVLVCSCVAVALIGCTNNAGYTIKFESNGGSTVADISNDGKSEIKFPEKPVMSGYDFDGWFVDNGTFSIKLDLAYIKANDANKTIFAYAKWVENGEATPEKVNFTVTFNTNGGNGSFEPITGLKKGDKIKEPKAPTRMFYVFAGWYKNHALTIAFNFDEEVITSDITLYAKWIESSSTSSGDNSELLTVTFITNCNEDVSARSIARGSKIVKPVLQERGGFRFIGWFSDADFKTPFDFNVLMKSNIVLHAKWAKLTESSFFKFEVLMVNNNAEYIISQNVDKKPVGVITMPNTYLGHPVTRIKASGFKDNKDITSILFPDNLGEIGDSSFEGCTSLGKNNDNNKLIIPETVLKIGANAFKGFNADQTIIIVGKSERPASWNANWLGSPGVNVKWANKVSFDLKGGTGRIADVFVQTGYTIEEPLVQPLKPNCVFRGWYKDVDFSNKFVFGSDIVEGSMTLIPWWEVSVKFIDGNNNKILAEVCLREDTKVAAFDVKNHNCGEGFEFDNFYFGNQPNAPVVDFDKPIKSSIEIYIRCHSKRENFIFTSTGVGECEISLDNDKALLTDYLVLPAKSGDGMKVTAIAAAGFSGDKSNSIKKLVLPRSVTKIGNNAFIGCTSVGKDVINSFILPMTVSEMGTNVFGSWTGEQKIISENTAMPHGWANDWSGTADVKWTSESNLFEFKGVILNTNGNKVDAYKISKKTNAVYGDSIVLPNMYLDLPVIGVAKGGFKGTNIKQVYCLNNMDIVEDEAFDSCTELTDITFLHDSVSFGKNAFRGDTELKKVNVRGGFAVLQEGVFEGCAKLETIKLSEKLTVIGKNALSGCTGIPEISIPKTVVTVSEGAFNGWLDTQEIGVSFQDAEGRPVGWVDGWSGNAKIVYAT